MARTPTAQYRRSPAAGLPGQPDWLAYPVGGLSHAAVCILFRQDAGSRSQLVGWVAATPGLSEAEALEHPDSRWGSTRSHAVTNYMRSQQDS